MYHMYAYLRDDRKINLRMVYEQYFINEALRAEKADKLQMDKPQWSTDVIITFTVYIVSPKNENVGNWW